MALGQNPPNNDRPADGLVDNIPPDARPVGATVTGFRPVSWNMQSVWESPFFWIFVGVGVTVLGIWAVKKKL